MTFLPPLLAVGILMITSLAHAQELSSASSMASSESSSLSSETTSTTSSSTSSIPSSSSAVSSSSSSASSQSSGDTSCAGKPGNAKTVCECKKLYPNKGKAFGMCVAKGAKKRHEEKKVKVLDKTTEKMKKVDDHAAKMKEKIQSKVQDEAKTQKRMEKVDAQAKKKKEEIEQKMEQKAQKKGRGGGGGY